MADRSATRPAEGDYDPYYETYVSQTPDGDIVEALRAQHEDLMALFVGIPDEKRGHAYGPDKWTIEEVIGHVVDIERAFSYRVMCFVRGLEGVAQPGVDQDVMVPVSGATVRGIDSLTREFDHLRRANVELFDSLGDEQLAKVGTASGMSATARAVIHLLYGHAEHHGKVLRERYL